MRHGHTDLSDTMNQQTATMHRQPSVTVRHEDLRVVGTAITTASEVFSLDPRTSHQRPGRVHLGRGDLVGQRVLVVQQLGPEITTALKRLDRRDNAYVLRSDNPDFPEIPGDASMRIIARALRRLDQADVNPFAARIGVRLQRRGISELYGSDFNPAFRQTGYASIGRDAVLLVTLDKAEMDTGKDYVDAFESPTTFTWSSQSRTSPDSKSGREVLDALETGMRLHLWARADKSTREYEYCGLIAPIDYEGSQPMQVRFRLLTPLAREAWAQFGSE
jgi:hypothetical protein